ncbi:hypothetical protein [Nonomuraea zeae]|uniref:Uncharacterized protein n=1 Tax=Nonomuraea zeae TaxID=1642303 RepID=A0A5S4F1G3_9ACTN|nr:hypothetical protein [Nonomuraea zeae]TMR09697.1 hypothetical protein ETD85_61210 [Nonomuraea zeae]
MKMIARAMVVAAVAAGSLAVAAGGSAAAAPPVSALGGWYVAATYPNTQQGWYDCGNATVNLYKGHCKIDSENTSIINLWAYRS